MNAAQQITFINALLRGVTAGGLGVPDFSNGGVGTGNPGSGGGSFTTPGSGSGTGTAGGFGLGDVIGIAGQGLDLYRRLSDAGVGFDPSALGDIFGGGGSPPIDGPGAIPSADGSAGGPGGFLGDIGGQGGGSDPLAVPGGTNEGSYGEDF